MFLGPPPTFLVESKTVQTFFFFCHTVVKLHEGEQIMG